MMTCFICHVRGRYGRMDGEAIRAHREDDGQQSGDSALSGGNRYR